MKTAVLVMTYGTPRSSEEIAPFFTDIRGGRPPTGEELERLQARYEAIGGLSPLTERSLAQVKAIKAALDRSCPGEFDVFYGTKHGIPKIDDAVENIAGGDFERLVGLVLAPHYSTLSIGDYIEKATQAAEARGIASTFVTHWHELPAFIQLLADRVRIARAKFSPDERVEVLFTAHSLPERIRQTNDPYVEQLEQSAALVAAAAHVEEFSIAWQSAGRSREPWLGPDLNEVLVDCSKRGVDAVVICPQGFTSDHLEVLYDLDIVAAKTAADHQLGFVRTPSLNDDPLLAAALAEMVIDRSDLAWSA